MYTLKKLHNVSMPAGDIRKFIKSSDNEFNGFGEVYFSYANNGHIKAWKKHKEMIMNVLVISGEVKFVFLVNDKFEEIAVKCSDNNLLTVYPNTWFGFEGIGKDNLICNFANLEHSEDELERKDVSDFKYKWRIE